jgi:hypothetical protein
VNERPITAAEVLGRETEWKLDLAEALSEAHQRLLALANPHENTEWFKAMSPECQQSWREMLFRAR